MPFLLALLILCKQLYEGLTVEAQRAYDGYDSYDGSLAAGHLI